LGTEIPAVGWDEYGRMMGDFFRWIEINRLICKKADEGLGRFWFDEGGRETFWREYI
jgi:hypothetical protein